VFEAVALGRVAPVCLLTGLELPFCECLVVIPAVLIGLGIQIQAHDRVRSGFERREPVELYGYQVPTEHLERLVRVMRSAYPSGSPPVAATVSTPAEQRATTRGATGWSVEDVAKAGTGPKMFQLYHHGDRGWVGELLARVDACNGYHSVCLTVDVQVIGRRERDIVNRYDPREAMKVAPNPRGPDSTYQARLTWDDVAWLQKTTKLPVGIKGIMTVRDARRAVDMGVRIIWVSNHGGRQLDHTEATIDALPRIADAVGGRAEIIVDGGFSRGTDVLKGLARGATVVAVGRTALWGLAVDGAPGVANAMDILRREVKTTMQLCGQTSITKLDPELVFRVD